MTISYLSADRKEEWDDFVHNNSEGTFFHLWGWKEVLERALGLKTFYMCAEENGRIQGVLPLALVKRPLFGPALMSLPLCVYGGALGEKAELENVAAELARKLDVQYLELRGREASAQDWPGSDMFYTFRRALSPDNEENLNAIPRKQRAEVRKGMAANLETRFDQDIDTFYKIYSASVRNLGTPVFAKKYLRVLIDVFGDACEVTTVAHEGKPLTSVLSFRYKDEILPYYGGGLPEARNYSAYPYMYWKVMENAAFRGVRSFDFGRSMKNSGAFSFKKNFGFEPQLLHYRYHLVKAKELPDMNPHTKRNQLITSCWSKLPLVAANKIGPLLYPVIM